MLKKEEFYRNFGENIRKFREERNMRIEELSVITGIRKEYLKKIEAGKACKLNSGYIFIFAKAFKIKPHEVVTGL